MTLTRMEALFDLREAGLTHKEIARCLGISEATSRRWCKRLGVVKPPRPLSAKWRRDYLRRRQNVQNQTKALDLNQGDGHR